ncbi:MAG: family 78 glycoside hydrolase catalytic domain, partial [Clostridia bacterium]|nr:family 78 glycoside hydrolase catalytic domain [Clostridia bacterium]
PRGYAKLCEAEPIRVTDELAPIKVCKGELAPYKRWKSSDEDYFEGLKSIAPERSGGYIYDFGKNTAGIFRFKIRNAKAGQVISFQCCENVNEEGKAYYDNINFFPDGYVQRDIYICRGDKEEEIFVPMFVYHGFRYVYVHGISEDQATEDALTYLVMNSDLKKRASFKCSNEIANKLWAAAVNSDLSNFYYFPTDCPHREKNGWTGDAASSCEHMIMSYEAENSYREWLSNIRAAQNEEGALPGIIPTSGWGFKWGNGPTFDRVLFELPYMCYIYRGNTDIIKENRHAMMRYLEYISNRRDENGLVAVGLGDWSVVGGKSESHYTVKVAFAGSVMVYDMCKKAEKMFLAIGNTLDASFARQLGEEIKAAVRKNLIDFETMTVNDMSQSGQALAIYYNIFEPSEKPEATRKLAQLVHMSDDNFEGGFLCLRVIFHVLAAFGEAELAYKMIMKNDFPSYAYYINQGMTSLPEIFRKNVSDCKSQNHHFFGDVNHWFMRHVVGINVNPMGDDANNIVVKPNFVADLDFAEGSYKAPAGKIYVKWEKKGENVDVTVRSDEGIKCEVRLPSGYMLGEDNYWRTYHVGGNCTLCALPRKNHF